MVFGDLGVHSRHALKLVVVAFRHDPGFAIILLPPIADFLAQETQQKHKVATHKFARLVRLFQT
jgi:hypothetical protein